MDIRCVIANELMKAAQVILAADYVHDPTHRHRPRSGNWHRTPHGWSSIPKMKMAPISFDDDDAPAQRLPTRRSVPPRMRLAPIVFDDEPAAFSQTEAPAVPEPTIEESQAVFDTPSDTRSFGMSREDMLRHTESYLGDRFQNVRRSGQDIFRFDCEGADVCTVQCQTRGDEQRFSFTVSGMPDGQSIELESDSLEEGVESLENAIASYEPDEEMARVRNGAQQLFKGWSIDDMYRRDDGTISVEVSTRALRNSYDVYCRMDDGEIVESDEYGRIDDKVKRLSRDTGIRNLEVSGTAY